MNDLLSNTTLVAAIIAVVLAQLLKTVFNLIFTKEMSFEHAFSTGGMPSSHTATVTAVTTTIALEHGLGSTLFALALVLSVIVIYDAVGIRRAAGKHAEVLNEWSRIFSEIHEKGFKPEDLKTLLGHTYPQVLAGIMLGCSTGFLVDYLL